MQNSKMNNWQSYSHLAEEYDSGRFTGKNGTFLFETDARIVRILHNEAKAQRTIDVPVGTGRVLRYLPRHNILGIDLTQEMLDVARSAMNPECHRLKLGNAAELPAEDGAFDCLISLRFFHLFPSKDRGQFAREFLRVVRPGGYIIVSFTNGWYGGGIGWLRRAVGMRTVYFEYRKEVNKLFPACQVVCRVGNYIPKQRILENIPGLRTILHKATTTFPLNRLCGEQYYLLQKPL